MNCNLLTKNIMYKSILLTLIVLLTACQKTGQESLLIEDAWVREAPPNASMLAGYVTLTNNTEEVLTLTSAASKQFNHVEIHRTVVENGVAKMRHQKELPIPAGESVKLEPGGYHFMLMHPESAVKADDEVLITVRFHQADDPNATQELDIVMPVKKP